MKILVIGTGAIGSFYGSLLAKAGAEVSVVARSDYDHIRAHGIEIKSDEREDWRFIPVAVYRHSSEIPGKPDCVLLCVKLAGGVDPVSLARDALGPDTAIVLIANGIDVERNLSEAFPSHELLSALSYVYATRISPGKIRHQGGGRLIVGRYPYGITPKAKILVEMLRGQGIQAETSDNIVTSRWGKSLWSVAFAALSVLSGGLTVREILETSEPLVREIMDEVCRIAAAVGHALPPGLTDKQIAFSWTMKPYKPSMLVDFEVGRAMETEIILGAPLRAARKANIPAPHLETLYALLTMREMKNT